MYNERGSLISGRKITRDGLMPLKAIYLSIYLTFLIYSFCHDKDERKQETSIKIFYTLKIL